MPPDAADAAAKCPLIDRLARVIYYCRIKWSETVGNCNSHSESARGAEPARAPGGSPGQVGVVSHIPGGVFMTPDVRFT
jgi:hypothetical protein